MSNSYRMGPDLSDSDDSLLADDGDYAFHKENFVKKRNHLKPAELTEEQKKEQDKNIFTNALSSGNITIALELLKKGFDVNTTLRDRWTPLLLSASYGNPELTKLILDYGGDITCDRDGVTPLMMACSCPESTASFDKSLEVVKMLIERGAKVQAINRKRMDALMYAASVGNLVVVKYLLPRANKRAMDNQQWTALTHAISNNELEVTKFLLSDGFDANVTDVRGNTPMEIAKEYGLSDILDLFPKKDVDLATEIAASYKLPFEAHFYGLKRGKRPRFFDAVCDILTAVSCSHLIPIFEEKKVSLEQFLAVCDEDLKNMGVLLPYQRNRILSGLYRFHKQPFHPKSVHICVKSNCYSNVDLATQVLSAIKQVIAMETSLKYIMKTLISKLTKEEEDMVRRSIRDIKLKIKQCKMVIRKLEAEFDQWDSVAEAADLITKKSMRKKFPWRKVTLCAGLLTVVLVCKLT